MQNEIAFIDRQKEAEVIQESKQKNYYIAKLDGNKIHTLVDYMQAIMVAFKFPEGAIKDLEDLDGYSDCMTDLSWLGQYDGYILIIEHLYKMLNRCDMDIKANNLSLFVDKILPYWQKAGRRVDGNGKSKFFKVYLVDIYNYESEN